MPALLAALVLAQAPTRLPETVVVETRHPTPIAETSPSVTRLDVAEATDAGLTTLSGALATTLWRSPMMKWSAWAETGAAAWAGVATGADWASNMRGTIWAKCYVGGRPSHFKRHRGSNPLDAGRPPCHAGGPE